MRGDTSLRNISLVFTGDEFRDGLSSIRKTLNSKGVKGAFFVTGVFLEDKESLKTLRSLIKEGHYIGPHSDKHLLYAPWENRDSLLISKEVFVEDLKANIFKLKQLGEQDERMFIPPFEWYNKSIVDWSKELGYDVYNFTPGIRTAADYTYPEMGKRYMSSNNIKDQLFHFEEANSLNGAIILIHIGTDNQRKDKFYNHLGYIIDTLRMKGYNFVSLNKI